MEHIRSRSKYILPQCCRQPLDHLGMVCETNFWWNIWASHYRDTPWFGNIVIQFRYNANMGSDSDYPGSPNHTWRIGEVKMMMMKMMMMLVMMMMMTVTVMVMVVMMMLFGIFYDTARMGGGRVDLMPKYMTSLEMISLMAIDSFTRCSRQGTYWLIPEANRNPQRSSNRSLMVLSPG